ncbi:MAG: metal ABC transporter ATP-binding protein [candidate division WOR-3 bacterium]
MSAIEFRDVTVAYQHTVALEEVSFRLEQGEFFGVIGPNGSGKTTLLKTVLGLIKPVKGRVTVLGADGNRIAAVRRRIGYVPQRKPIDPNFPVSVLDAVLMGLYPSLGLLRSPGKRERDKAMGLLHAVGLEGNAYHIAGHLSGGQQQRLFLARALMQEPEILLLDEPTAGVDVATRGQIVELVRTLHKERGLTTVYVTHDLNEIMLCVDKVMLLNRRIQAFGTCAEVLKPEVLKRLYGIPVLVVEQDNRRYVVVGDHHA